MTNNVNYGIFLDDERIPEDVYWMEIKNNEVQYKIVRNFEDFKDSEYKDSTDFLNSISVKDKTKYNQTYITTLR